MSVDWWVLAQATEESEGGSCAREWVEDFQCEWSDSGVVEWQVLGGWGVCEPGGLVFRANKVGRGSCAGCRRGASECLTKRRLESIRGLMGGEGRLNGGILSPGMCGCLVGSGTPRIGEIVGPTAVVTGRSCPSCRRNNRVKRSRVLRVMTRTLRRNAPPRRMVRVLVRRNMPRRRTRRVVRVIVSRVRKRVSPRRPAGSRAVVRLNKVEPGKLSCSCWWCVVGGGVGVPGFRDNGLNVPGEGFNSMPG